MTITDKELMSGNYTLYENPKDSSQLIGINENLELPAEFNFVNRGDFSIREAGKLKKFQGQSGVSYPFSFYFGNLEEDRVSGLAKAIVKDIKGKYGDSFDHGLMTDYDFRFDNFESSNLYQGIMGNTTVKGMIHLVSQDSKKPLRGEDIDSSFCSRYMKENFPNLDYRHQFHANIGESQIVKIRDKPGSSGWDIDILNEGIGAGYKYHRGQEISQKQISFTNSIGTFDCSIRVLKKIKNLRILSIAEVMTMNGGFGYEL